MKKGRRGRQERALKRACARLSYFKQRIAELVGRDPLNEDQQDELDELLRQADKTVNVIENTKRNMSEGR